MHEIKKTIEKHTLANAVSHDGKAHHGAIIGKVLAEHPKAKAQMKEIMPEIHKTVSEVNDLPHEEQKKRLFKIWPQFFHKEKREKNMAELPGAVDGKVVTRFPPEPGKYMTVGHALSFLINYIYAQKYHGKCVLRFEDTNAEKANQEAVDSFLDSTKRFLDIKPSKIVFISDDILKIYKEIEKLINKKQAYVCSCSAEHMSKFRRKKQECEHRKQTAKKNFELWSQMLKGKDGFAVRLMGDMTSDNATLRDPVIARTNKIDHYRHKKKYCVWPTYDFANTCEDEWCEITHILRGIEFGNERIELQKYIAKLLGFREKYYIQYGRINVSGLEKSSGRVLRALVEKGSGWDDPRMPTIKALERRGFVKETFYQMAKDVGLSKTPTKIDEKTLAAINRKFIDPIANRYFFVKDATKVVIKKAPHGLKKIQIKVHPDKSETRNINVSNHLYLNHQDILDNVGKEIRLKSLYNVIIPNDFGAFNKKLLFSSSLHKFGLSVIQWVPKEHVKVEILLTNGKKIKGLAEKNVEKLKMGDIIQFERFGFCRLDKNENGKITFVWAHQ